MTIPKQLSLFPELELNVHVLFPEHGWLFSPFDLEAFVAIWGSPVAPVKFWDPDSV